MKVLIAGGAGYIGSHCVKIMNEQGYDVVTVDNLSTGHQGAVKGKLYVGDIRDEAFLDDLFKKEKIDAVIHFVQNLWLANQWKTFGIFRQQCLRDFGVIKSDGKSKCQENRLFFQCCRLW